MTVLGIRFMTMLSTAFLGQVSAQVAPDEASRNRAPQNQVTQSAEYLTRIDTDRNGRVSLAEYQDWLSYAFDSMDKNRDAILSANELPGGRGAQVSRDSYRATLALAFDRQDRNEDGVLDARELAAPPH